MNQPTKYISDEARQLSFPGAEPIARNVDPGTSHLSAEYLTESGKRDAQKRLVLDAVINYPNMTSRELAEITGIDNEVFHKRLPDLRRDGWLWSGDPRECRITHRHALIWKRTK